jgi:hypothetical protein
MNAADLHAREVDKVLESEYASPVGQDDLTNSMDIEDVKSSLKRARDEFNAIVNCGRTEEEWGHARRLFQEKAVDDGLCYNGDGPSLHDDEDDESL